MLLTNTHTYDQFIKYLTKKYSSTEAGFQQLSLKEKKKKNHSFRAIKFSVNLY